MSLTTRKTAILALAIGIGAISERVTLAQYRSAMMPQARRAANYVPLVQASQPTGSYAYAEIGDTPAASTAGAQPNLWAAETQQQTGGDVGWGSPVVAPAVTGPPVLHGFYFQYDHLVWTLTDPDITVIGIEGGERTDIDGQTFQTNDDLSTDISGRAHSAERFDFGHWEGDRGWMSSIMFGQASRNALANGVNFVPHIDPADADLLRGFLRTTASTTVNDDGELVPSGEVFDQDRNNNFVHGRDGEDLEDFVEYVEDPVTGGTVEIVRPRDGVPDTPHETDWDDLYDFPINFEQLQVRSVVDVFSGEVNRTVRPWMNCELFYGIRYFDFRDHLSLTGRGSVISPFSLATVAKNQMVGPQIGARLNKQAYKFIFNIEGRFVPAYNHQTVTQRGQFSNASTWDQDLIYLPPTSIERSFETDVFSVVGELRADAILPINRFLAFRVGYTGTVLGGISYASPKVVYQFPNFGVTDVDSDDTVFMNAFTVGLEVNR